MAFEPLRVSSIKVFLPTSTAVTNPVSVLSSAYTAGAIDSMRAHSGAVLHARSSRRIIEGMFVLFSLKGCRSREDAVKLNWPLDVCRR